MPNRQRNPEEAAEAVEAGKEVFRSQVEADWFKAESFLHNSVWVLIHLILVCAKGLTENFRILNANAACMRRQHPPMLNAYLIFHPGMRKPWAASQAVKLQAGGVYHQILWEMHFWKTLKTQWLCYNCVAGRVGGVFCWDSSGKSAGMWSAISQNGQRIWTLNCITAKSPKEPRGSSGSSGSSQGGV